MDENSDEKTLYFSEDELDNETQGERKVYVTKRINGKESHVKTKKRKKALKKEYEDDLDKKDTFDFDNEIVIGVNIIEDRDEKKGKKKKKSKTQNRNEDSRKYEKKDKKKKKSKTKNRNEDNKKYENIDNRKNKSYNKKQYGNQEEYIEKRNPRKKAKKRRKSKILIKIFSLAIIVAIIIVFALVAPIFNITEIQVEGNSKISKENIISLSGINIGDNIFKYNNSIKNNIKENAYINTVNIKRKFPGTIKIIVEERVAQYQLNLINSFVYIDKYGYILEKSENKISVPLISGMNITEGELLNTKRLNQEDLQKLNKIVKIEEATKTINLKDKITEINTENESDYILYIESENKKIHIGDVTGLTNKMLYIKKMIEAEAGKSGTMFVNGDLSERF